MKQAEWGVAKAAAFGAVLGVVFVLARPLLLDESYPNMASSLVFLLLGGVIGGAFLFVVIASKMRI